MSPVFETAATEITPSISELNAAGSERCVPASASSFPAAITTVTPLSVAYLSASYY